MSEREISKKEFLKRQELLKKLEGQWVMAQRGDFFCSGQSWIGEPQKGKPYYGRLKNFSQDFDILSFAVETDDGCFGFYYGTCNSSSTEQDSFYADETWMKPMSEEEAILMINGLSYDLF